MSGNYISSKMVETLCILLDDIAKVANSGNRGNVICAVDAYVKLVNCIGANCFDNVESIFDIAAEQMAEAEAEAQAEVETFTEELVENSQAEIEALEETELESTVHQVNPIFDDDSKLPDSYNPEESEAISEDIVPADVVFAESDEGDGFTISDDGVEEDFVSDDSSEGSDIENSDLF